MNGEQDRAIPSTFSAGVQCQRQVLLRFAKVIDSLNRLNIPDRNGRPLLRLLSHGRSTLQQDGR